MPDQGSLFGDPPAAHVKQSKPCAWCGEQLFIIEPARGPHGFHLRCSGCGRGGRWMPLAETEQLKSKATP